MACRGCEATGSWFQYGHCVLDDPRIFNSFEGRPFYRPFNASSDSRPLHTVPLAQDSSTPIYRLPTELLREIFLFLPDFLQTSEWLEGNPYAHWISILAVCKLWRDIAVTCPALWTYVSTNFARAHHDKPNMIVVGMLLKRSLALPLSVTIVGETPFEVLRRIYGQLHRIKRLKVQTDREMQALTLLQNTYFSNVRASRLEVLEVCSLDNRLTAVALPSILCPGARPLRSLTLRRCHLKWDSDAYSKLQILILDKIDLHGRAAPDIATLLTLLRNCPNLDMLCIDLIPFNPSIRRNLHPPDSDTTYALVKLPFLQRLVLKHVSAQVCRFFMRSVQFPARTRWTIHAHDFPWQAPIEVMPKYLQGADSVTELRAYIADKEGYFLEPTRIGRLAVSTFQSNNEKVSVAHVAKLITPMHWAASITSLVLVVKWHRDKNSAHDEELLRNLDPRSLASQQSQPPQRSEQYEGAWRILFTALPSLATFTFSCGRSSLNPEDWNTHIAYLQTARTEAELFLALGPPLTIGKPALQYDGKDAYLCHSLKTIHLSAVNFADWHPRSADGVWQKMVFVLKMRRKHGIGLQKLDLKEVVGVPQAGEEILRKCVEEVAVEALKTEEPIRQTTPDHHHANDPSPSPVKSCYEETRPCLCT